MQVADDGAARIGEEGPAPSPSDDGEELSRSTTSPVPSTGAGAESARLDVLERRHRLFWWKEALIVIVFYVVYSWIRNQFGSNRIAAEGIPRAAFHNAQRVIGFQQTIGVYPEPTVQQWWLENMPGIRLWNIFYGSAHFVVTLAVFAVLFWKRPSVFPQWRNTLAAMTALAIIGFAFFPLMPPRLLDQPCPWEGPNEFGGRCLASEWRGDDGTFGYVDTLAEYGGLWSFDQSAFASISNQYAAMPSLHIGWSTWCAIAMWPLLRRWRWRLAMLAYPSVTLFCIIVTGNHWWLDGVGGLLAFGVGSLIGWSMHRWNQDRLDGQHLRLHGVHPTAST
jgi:hypothetical protein